jgi:hypothetical protein
MGFGRARLVMFVAGAALVGGACGGGGGKVAVTQDAAAADPTTTTTVAGDAGAAYATCLKDHGVDIPDRPRPADGSGGPPSSRPQGSDATGGPPSSRPAGARPSTSLPAGVDQAKVAAARDACQSLQPTDRGPQNGPPSQAFQAYTSCMKDHGVTVVGGAPAGGTRDDPAFTAADAICGVLRPAPTTTTTVK